MFRDAETNVEDEDSDGEDEKERDRFRSERDGKAVTKPARYIYTTYTQISFTVLVS